VSVAIGLLLVYYAWHELRGLPETRRALKFHNARIPAKFSARAGHNALGGRRVSQQRFRKPLKRPEDNPSIFC
jgi:hypothetical protein